MDIAIERNLIKAVLFMYFYQHVHGNYEAGKERGLMGSTLECYTMDTKLIQYLIREILATGNYTLEGIALYTHIPFDVILDAATGRTQHLFVTSWMKIVELYTQVKPDVVRVLLEKILEMCEKDPRALEALLRIPS